MDHYDDNPLICVILDSDPIHCAYWSDLSEFPEELSVAEEYHSKRENETGGEESDDVAVIHHAGCVPVQR